MDPSDEDIQLPPDTFQILKDFLAEKELREKIEHDSIYSQNKNSIFEEDWVNLYKIYS